MSADDSATGTHVTEFAAAPALLSVAGLAPLRDSQPEGGDGMPNPACVEVPQLRVTGRTKDRGAEGGAIDWVPARGASLAPAPVIRFHTRLQGFHVEPAQVCPRGAYRGCKFGAGHAKVLMQNHQRRRSMRQANVKDRTGYGACGPTGKDCDFGTQPTGPQHGERGGNKSGAGP